MFEFHIGDYVQTKDNFGGCTGYIKHITYLNSNTKDVLLTIYYPSQSLSFAEQKYRINCQTGEIYTHTFKVGEHSVNNVFERIGIYDFTVKKTSTEEMKEYLLSIFKERYAEAKSRQVNQGNTPSGHMRGILECMEIVEDYEVK